MQKLAWSCLLGQESTRLRKLTRVPTAGTLVCQHGKCAAVVDVREGLLARPVYPARRVQYHLQDHAQGVLQQPALSFLASGQLQPLHWVI